MGARLYRNADANGPELAAFDQRIRELLDYGLPFDEDGNLAPPAIMLSNAAFNVWREFHDAVERSLAPADEFGELTDFAAKTAEQAARLAGIFHVLEHGPTGEIGGAGMESAAAVL